MNLPKLSFSYLKNRTLNTLLNVLLLALGIATIVVLLLFSKQFEDNLTRNAEGIDLVVGAKGSPLQLILSSIYHMDVPTGNIPVAEAQQIMQNRAVQQAIPLALGDSYNGYRIVGTTPDYAAKYEATPAEGALWDGTMEVTIGASVAEAEGLSVGDELTSTHGLSEDGEGHGENPLRVVGILAPTGTVVDRLVLTSVETVWALHGTHVEDDDDHAEGEDHAEDSTAAAPMPPRVGPGGLPFPPPGGAPGPQAGGPEYTALLVSYSSPMAAVMFPRFVNTQTSLQAASPAFETTRLLSLLGVGIDALRAFGLILILAAALGVFIALYNALKERQYDLAIMRTLGASRGKLLMHVLLEGLLLAAMGTALGLVLGHFATELLGGAVQRAQQMRLTGWTWTPEEFVLIILALGVGLVAALLPALQAYRTDIARTLARR